MSIGKRIYGIEEELNVEYQIQENFYFIDYEKNNGNKENYCFPNIQEFRKMSLLQKKIAVNEMKKQNLKREMEIKYEEFVKASEILFEEKDFLKAQQKNLIHYPMAYYQPLFDSMVLKNKKDIDYFVEHILLIDEKNTVAAFNLITFYGIPKEFNAFDFRGILKWKGLDNIVLDDENLDVVKFCEIMSMLKDMQNQT